MKIGLDQIKVDEEIRIRKETGSLEQLESSIESVGLINPILIDEHNNLVAGYRRLNACKNLGWQDVDVRVVTFKGDQLKMLDVEVAENFFRKDFTPEEVLSTERRRQELIEQLRKKNIFERFWLWLKSLFQSDPKPTQSAPVPIVNTTVADRPSVEKPIADTPLVQTEEQLETSSEEKEETNRVE